MGFAALSLGLLLSSTGAADESPLTLAEAQRLALQRSRQLEASRLGVRASQGLAVAAGERPDPVAKIGLENLPINGPDAFSVQQDFMTMRSVGIMQEITRPSKLRARTAESAEAVRLAEAKEAQTLVEIRRDSALAWLNRYYAEASRRTVLQELEATGLEVTAAEAAYRGGRGTAADVLAARQALAEFEDLAAAASLEVEEAKTALERWVLDSSDRPLVGEPSIDTIPLHAANIATMIDAWDSARERRERYHTSIIPLAADRVVAARAAYGGGKATLNDLLSAHRAQIDARLKALALEATAARLWAQLAFLDAPPEILAATPTVIETDRGALP